MPVSILRCQCGSYYLPQRYVFTLMAFLGVVLAYSTRSCLHVAINEMVRHKPRNETSNVTGACPNPNPEKEQKKGGTFDWSENDQAVLLSAFFYGYIASHLPGGMTADYYGGKHVFGTAILLSGISSFFTPTVIHIWKNPWPVAALRLLMGLGQGPLFPASLSLVGKWAPKNERSLIGSIVITGSQIGSITGNYITSGIISHTNDWQLAFYFWGGASLAWYLIYIVLVYSEPAQCPFITEEEAAMLQADIGASQRLKIPWKAILTSCPIWCVVIVSIGHDLIFFFLGVQYPKYLDNVLHFNLDEIGIYTSTPYVLLFMSSNISAYFCDKLISSGAVSTLNVRKFFTFVGSSVPGIFFVYAVYMGCDRMNAVVMFYCCLVAMGPYYPGLRVNPVDLTKNFTGIVMAIVNGVGAMAFIPLPHIAGHFTKGHSPDEWIPVFWGMSIISVVSTFPFLIWGQAEKQEWDK